MATFGIYNPEDEKIVIPPETQTQEEQTAVITPGEIAGPYDARLKAAQERLDFARKGYAVKFQDLFDQRRKTMEQARTDNAKMARFNAIGNALRTLVQPIGWAAGGSTAPVQPYDNRQYLESFNRAVKAADDIRNLGKEEMAFKLGQEAEEVADAKREYEVLRQAKIQSDYAAQRQEEEMAKIQARGDVQKEVADVKARYKVTGRNGIPVGDKMLTSAWTAYNGYLSDYQKKKTAGVVVPDRPLSFEEYLGDNKIGPGYNVTPASGSEKPQTKTSGASAPWVSGGNNNSDSAPWAR